MAIDHTAGMPSLRRLRATFVATLALASAGCASLPFGSGGREVWAFTAPWDAGAAASLERARGQVDVVVSGWIALDSLAGQPRPLFNDTMNVGDARRFALVTTWHGERFHPEVVRRLAGDSSALAQAADRIASLASGTTGAPRYDGVVLDLEGLGPGDLTALRIVTFALANGARRGGARTVAIAVPALDTAAYPLAPLLEAVDVAIVLLYDEHWAGSEPGAIASPVWARNALATRVAEVGGRRIVAALPLHGYQWRANERAVSIGWQEAQRLVGSAGGRLERDPSSLNLRASMDEPGVPGQRWELWVSDAELVAQLARDARALGVRRLALWRLGIEDPALWEGALR